MNDAATLRMPVPEEHSSLDRIAVWISWAVAGGIFLTLGWLAVAPDDPLSPVSLLARTGAASAWGQSLALACVTGVAATLIAGRRVREIGVFSGAVGLVAVSFRGHTIDALLYRAADPVTWADRHVALALAAESLAWVALLAIVALLCGWIGRWCFAEDRGDRMASRNGSPSPMGSPTSMDIRGGWAGVIPRADGFRHAGVVLIVSLVGFRIFSTGLYSRSIQHGQVCFVVAASVALGVYVATRAFPVDSPRWSLPPAVLLGIVGYLIAGLTGGVSSLTQPTNIPGSHFLRVLPIQSVGVGVISAIATFWNLQPPLPPTERPRAVGAGDRAAQSRPPARSVP